MVVGFKLVSCNRNKGGKEAMFDLWRNNRVTILIYSMFLMIFLVSCSSLRSQGTLSYHERRHIPLENELEIQKFEPIYSEEDEYYTYNKENIGLKLSVEDAYYYGATLEINGVKFPFSYEGYLPVAELPEICVYDINRDGIQDLLLRAEAYKVELRQDAYVSQIDGGYLELGDATWGGNLLNAESFSFSASYENGHMVHVSVPEWSIDETIEIASEDFLVIALELGIYDNNGNVTDYGREAYAIECLQGQAVRYLLEEDGIILRYEAQLWTGYSEYCIGWCFVFEYSLTEDGYVLENVTLERFDY